MTTINAIYEVYNINHVKCEVDDCCTKCSENFKIIKDSKPPGHRFLIMDSSVWIDFCMNKKNHIITNIMPIEYNSSITKNTFLYDNQIIKPSLEFIIFLFNKNHPDLIYYVKKFLELQKKYVEILKQIRTIDVLKLIIDNNIMTYDWFLTLDLNNYPILSKLLITYDTINILSTCCHVNQVTEDAIVIEDGSVTDNDVVIEDGSVTNDEEDSELDARLNEDVYNQTNSFNPDYLELDCVIC